MQLELIELIATGNLFTVGDAQQSIYGFRHADVELFERLGERLAAVGARATLDTNFRSRPEILAVINGVFEHELGEQLPAAARRARRRPDGDDADGSPRVELLVADKGAEWTMEGLGSPWRIAEARALAARVERLLGDGTAARDVVLLTRATTDLRVYERALEDRGIPTYVIGGRGYWAHPQVIDMVGYLEALANPRDEEALFTVLASPLVGVSADALVVLAATAARPPARPVVGPPRAGRSVRCVGFCGSGFTGSVRRPVRHRAGGGRPRRRRAADRPRARSDGVRPGGARDAGRAAAPGQHPQAHAPGARARGGARARPPWLPGTGARARARRLGPRRRRARERGPGRRGGARRGAADDDPPRQGARVRGRVRRRSRPGAAVADRADPGRAGRPVRDAAGASPAPAGASRRSTTRRSATSGSRPRRARSGACSTSP